MNPPQHFVLMKQSLREICHRGALAPVCILPRVCHGQDACDELAPVSILESETACTRCCYQTSTSVLIVGGAPGASCLCLKFSSAKVGPYIDSPPVPSLRVKSPPWHICVTDSVSDNKPLQERCSAVSANFGTRLGELCLWSKASRPTFAILLCFEAMPSSACKPAPPEWQARVAHKVWDDSVELAALEVKLVAGAPRAAADAQHAEVLCGARYRVCVQRDCHPSGGLAVQLNVQKYARVVHGAVHGRTQRRGLYLQTPALRSCVLMRRKYLPSA